jgi:hypothetical protein
MVENYDFFKVRVLTVKPLDTDNNGVFEKYNLQQSNCLKEIFEAVFFVENKKKLLPLQYKFLNCSNYETACAVFVIGKFWKFAKRY